MGASIELMPVTEGTAAGTLLHSSLEQWRGRGAGSVRGPSPHSNDSLPLLSPPPRPVSVRLNMTWTVFLVVVIKISYNNYDLLSLNIIMTLWTEIHCNSNIQCTCIISLLFIGSQFCIAWFWSLVLEWIKPVYEQGGGGVQSISSHSHYTAWVIVKYDYTLR